MSPSLRAGFESVDHAIREFDFFRGEYVAFGAPRVTPRSANLSMADPTQRLGKLDTCAVSDALDKLGLKGAVSGLHCDALGGGSSPSQALDAEYERMLDA